MADPILEQPAVRLALRAFPLAVLLFIFSDTLADPDLWGHLRFGLDFLAHGLTRTDTYSYVTAGQRWINHEWLAEALMALAWTAAGAAGLVGLKVTVVLVAAAVVLRHLDRFRVPAIDAAIVVIYSSLLMLPWLTFLRPQVFTYACFAFLLTLLARADRGQVRALWAAVLLMAVWANLHGGFLAGVAAMTVWWVSRALLEWTGRVAGDTSAVARRALPPVLCAGAATLITPYGLELWAFLRTAFASRREISEWNPVDTAGVEGFALAALLVPVVAAWMTSRRERRPALGMILLCLAVAPFVARRHTPLFAIGAMVIGGEHMADLVRRTAERLARSTEERARSAPRLPPRRGLAVLLWTGTAIFVALSLPYFRRIEYTASHYPVAAVRMLQAASVRGNMVTFFDWGEYAIWHLAPDIRVSMDGRRETVYPDDVYKEAMALVYGVGRWDAALERGHPALALVSRGFAAYNLIKTAPAWRLVLEDDRSALFVRAESEQATRLKSVAVPAAIPEDALLRFP